MMSSRTVCAIIERAEVRRFDVLDLRGCSKLEGLDHELAPRFGGYLALPFSTER
jgi:hypothetical protein